MNHIREAWTWNQEALQGDERWELEDMLYNTNDKSWGDQVYSDQPQTLTRSMHDCEARRRRDGVVAGAALSAQDERRAIASA